MLSLTDAAPTTYDWFADIWVPALGILASVGVGLAAVYIGRKSNALSASARRLAESSEENERKRAEREEKRQAYLERLDFAAMLRDYVELLRQTLLFDKTAPSVEEMGHRRTHLEDVAHGIGAEAEEALRDVDNAMRTAGRMTPPPQDAALMFAHHKSENIIRAYVRGKTDYVQLPTR